MKLHPQIIQKNGKKEFVILPYEEFTEIKELIEDYEDLRELRAAKAGSANEESIPLDKVIKEVTH